MTKQHAIKKDVPPTGTLYPCPPALITTIGKDGKANIFTAAWVSQICMEPPHIGVAIRPSRHSFTLLEETGVFGVNLPLASQVREVDICGTISGRDQDKWLLTGFTPQEPSKTQVPLILECPVGIECKVVNKVPVGSHVWIVGEVLARAQVEDFDPGELLAYVSRNYRGIGKEILGYFGFSTKESD